MEIDLPSWEKDGSPLPSVHETALGLYLSFRKDKGLDHGAAFAATVEGLVELFPEIPPLELNVGTITAVRVARLVMAEREPLR